MLNREILLLGVLLELLPLLVASRRHVETFLDLYGVVAVERRVGLRPAPLIIAILELIQHLELLPSLVDFLALVWLQVRHFRFVEDVAVEGCVAVNNLVLVRALL